MNIRLFSPENIKPEDYRHRYPELNRETAFADLSPRALVFVWYYANQTSPLVLDINDDYIRSEEALKKSGYNPGKTEKDAILKLQFNSDMAAAIKKMGEYDPGIRFRSYKMVRTVFDEYEKIIKKGPTTFIDKEIIDDEQNNTSDKNPYYIDRYVVTSNRIIDIMPSLINKLEEGFGVLDVKGNELIEEDEVTSIRDWHKKREHINE